MKKIVIAMLAAAALVLTGCSSSTEGSAAAAAEAGPWTFTDDLGKTVTLDHRPARVAGLNELVVSLMQYGITPVAAWGYSSIKNDDRFKSLDTSKVTEVGATFGEIDIEKLTAAAPELIVAHVYPTDEKGTIDKTQPDYGFKDVAQQTQIAKIAPIVTILMGGDGASVIKRTTELATSLGAPADKVAAAEKTYTAAKTDLKAAATESKVQVTALYADADGVSVAKAQDDPALRLYADTGVDFFKPTPDGFYWGNYSWENAGKIGGDVFLLNATGYQTAELLKQPTIAATAAVKADQIHPWSSSGLDYVSQAAYMTQLAGFLRGSKKVR
ncbi:ABC transporter substrate-binding protein [Paractinoplanes durhamensis]|uniref:Fe/B12 periplasmic-binding domain-containing protein n=1 Tax=Paractinoplanes durhamensis TaxID=113563 RepID=A0ABQ3YZF0_9ACTN|nr:ABC transporter substrate-binding protein [Actinoplanes durhamensis]GIE02959.1 hypothetical protein Adu01nite_43090 [Actinoplanes durhamensis]